jgi:hypothetical protein
MQQSYVKEGSGILGTIATIFLIWFIFFRPSEHYEWITDLRKIWWSGTETQIVYIDNYGPYYLPVSVMDEDEIGGDARFIYELTVHFDNGGYLNFEEARCDKSAKNLNGHRRVCEGVYYDQYGDTKNIVIFPMNE